MSRWHLQHAWELCMEHELTQIERLVLLAIASHINAKTGQWRIGIPTIAREAGVSDSRTRKTITALRNRGLLASHLQPGDRAVTWWLPMVPSIAAKARAARGLEPERPEDYGPNDTGDQATTAQEGRAATAHNTYRTPNTEDTCGNSGDFTNVERSFAEAFVKRGDTPERAIAKVLQMRPRQEAV